MAAIFNVRSGVGSVGPLQAGFRFRTKYLDIIGEQLGDWVIFLRPRRPNEAYAGRLAGYFAAASVAAIRPTADPAYWLAKVEQYFEFPRPVPFRAPYPSSYYESAMRQIDGSVNSSLVQQEARRLSDEDCMTILRAGMGEAWIEPPRIGHANYGFGFGEDPPPADERTRILTSPLLRDRAFRRLIGEAYGCTCAMTGTCLQAPDGRHEIECAHIRPIEKSGSDSAGNGIALSRTIHWLFDKGLLSIDADYTILVSSVIAGQKAVCDLLIRKPARIHLPKDPYHWPHQGLLHYHRSNIFRP
ncbi:HNH endonuclease [Phyllobacterium sp. 21LDTY02-6]|uniref:HNH endonuclease n=1 Tax=Phyllobacterium sp. 21LDTY02-6 TaxID=2944903 RepID=UPI0020211A7D|nr:HNH endonuclease [Phyllobacterium sp. 21LDTY02-6]MCO4315840.1 HNH endonuclease [Phyllobacterium sp. 21LDTY02-6]